LEHQSAERQRCLCNHRSVTMDGSRVTTRQEGSENILLGQYLAAFCEGVPCVHVSAFNSLLKSHLC
jgi:hypothetical protein